MNYKYGNNEYVYSHKDANITEKQNRPNVCVIYVLQGLLRSPIRHIFSHADESHAG